MFSSEMAPKTIADGITGILWARGIIEYQFASLKGLRPPDELSFKNASCGNVAPSW